jgi:hydroxyacylglutathione hydrolase
VHVATSEVYATTTSVLVGDDGGCLVVDPGVTAREIAGIVREIEECGWRPVAVWSTHDHWDHRLDGPGLTELPRWGVGDDVPTARLARERDEDEELARVLRHADDEPAPIGRPPTAFPRSDGDPSTWPRLDWPGPRALVLEHAGHAAGHTALLLPDVGVLVAGDMLSDVEIPLLDLDADDPLEDHRAGLDLLAGTGATLVVPGHGRVGADLHARISSDRAYIDALTDPHALVDPRLTTDWLCAAHRRQHDLVVAAHQDLVE